MTLQNQEINVVIVANKEAPATYTIVVLVPGLPPYTSYEVPLAKVVETVRAMHGEVMQ